MEETAAAKEQASRANKVAALVVEAKAEEAVGTESLEVEVLVEAMG